MVAKKKKYVSEAKKLGLSCGVTEKLCSVQTPSVCSDKELCMYSSNGVNWTSNNTLKKYVNEAKRRGLTCGIGNVPNDFRQAFISQSQLKRKQLQYALKELRFYTYGVDGLWGKGTKKNF